MKTGSLAGVRVGRPMCLGRMVGAILLSFLVLGLTGDRARAGGRVDSRLAPPKEERTAHPTLGDPKAPVTMMVFGDFQCPFSSRLVKTLKLLVKDQPRKVKVVWRDFPLAFHKEAKPAAVVGQEVFLQKGSSAFWAFTELVFANPRGLSEAALLTFAGQVGAEVAKVRLALGQAQGRASKAVERDMKDGAAAGVKGTPASFLFRDGTPLRNAKQLPGARQYPDLKAEVDGI